MKHSRKGSKLKKTDAEVYTTADRRMLAKIAVYVQGNGVHLRSMSEMLRFVLGTFEVWIDQKGARPIETTHEATEILHSMFRASLNAGNRLQKSLLENYEQDEEDLIMEEPPKPEINRVYERVISQYLGLKPEEPKLSDEERILREEYKNNAIARMEDSIEEQLTPLQIERNKIIAEVTNQKVEAYKGLAMQAKTPKDQDFYIRKVQMVAKFSQRASEGDNEAFRVLADEL